MTSITTELIDALLSPGGGTGSCSSRDQAEKFIESLTVDDRVRGCFSLILELHNNSQNANNDTANTSNVGRQMMLCVLLRRDIIKLISNATLLKEMIEPMLTLFTDRQYPCRRHMGHCIAEICSTLSSTIIATSTNNNEKQVLQDIIKTIASKISPDIVNLADIESIRLVSSIADRSPLLLWNSGIAQNIPTWIQSAISSATASSSSPLQQPVSIIEALVEMIVYVGISCDLATNPDKQKQQQMMPMVPNYLLGGGEVTADELKINPSSQASQFGQTCLQPILDVMIQQQQSLLLNSTSRNDDMICKCMEHLSHSAIACPSLLAGNMQTFQSLLYLCMMVASSSSCIENKTRLSALEVISTISDIGDVKRKILSSGGELRNALLNGTTTPCEVKGIFHTCIDIIVNGIDDDVDGWASDPATLVDNGDEWDDDDDALYAETLLESLLHNLGGMDSLNVILPAIEALMNNNSESWKYKRGALSILERCLIAMPITFSKYITVALEAALQQLAPSSSGHCSTTNVRVQYQAMHLLGAICEADNGSLSDGEGLVREKYGLRILQAIAYLLQSSKCGKVVSISSLSVVSYCRGGSKNRSRSNSGDSKAEDLVVPYLKDILMSLVSGPLSIESLDIGSITVKVRAIGAIACLAESSGGVAFVPFYQNVMPGLLACAQTPQQQSPAGSQHELSLLRGAAIECATIIGQAIGDDYRDLFAPDAEQIMKFALPLLSADGGSLIIPTDQLLAACARIASVMKESYVPFVDTVLPHLLNRASSPPDISITDGNEADLATSRRNDITDQDDGGTESMTVALPGKGIKKITINTTQMQEKALACRAVYEHATALGAAFGPYAETTLQTFLPLVNFKYSAEVRSTSAQALSAIYESACAYAMDEYTKLNIVQKSLRLIANGISKQISEEDTTDMEVLYALADSLSEVYYSAYSRLVSTEGQIVSEFNLSDAHNAVVLLMKSIKACLERRSNLIRTMEGCDGTLTGQDELEEYAEMLQCEQDLLTPLVDCVGYTLKFFKEGFVPIFDAEVAPVLGQVLTATNNSDARAMFAAICLYDDCVEHCGAAAATKHAPQLTQGIMLALCGNQTLQQDGELKRVAIYGLAQIARYAPSCPTLAANAQNIVQQLLAICNVPTKDEADDVYVLENSVSALGSLSLFGKAPLGDIKIKDKITESFVKHLPLLEDEDEAKICHDGLCDLVEGGSINAAKQAPVLLKIIGETMENVNEGYEIATPQTCARFADILFTIQSQASDVQQSFASISPQAQTAVNCLMEQHSLSRSNVVTP